MAIEKLGFVLIPAPDMDAAVRFYHETLGMPMKFRDGDRFAAIQCGEVTLGLVGPEERDPSLGVAPSIKATDLDALATRLKQAGVASHILWRRFPRAHWTPQNIADSL